MSDTPHDPNAIQNDTDINSQIPPAGNRGMTTITERKMEVGHDGIRRLLIRRRIIPEPPEEKNPQ
jgi:hypothetical protein